MGLRLASKWIKIEFTLLLLVVACFGAYRFYDKLEQASADDAVKNSLRNLYALAGEYSRDHGNQAVVEVSSLDPRKLEFAGVRPFRRTVYPTKVVLGQPLTATSADGERTLVLEPGK